MWIAYIFLDSREVTEHCSAAENKPVYHHRKVSVVNGPRAKEVAKPKVVSQTCQSAMAIDS